MIYTYIMHAVNTLLPNEQAADSLLVTLGDLRQMPGHLLRRAQQINGAIFADELGEAGETELTSVQYMALVAIRDHPHADATLLSGLIFFDRATIGGVLERLLAKGLVRRQGSVQDRRVKELNITEAGISLLRQINAAVLRVQERLLENFSPEERETFLALLGKLIDGPGSAHLLKGCSRIAEMPRNKKEPREG